MKQYEAQGNGETIKPYKKDMDYSYTLGAFPTYELIQSRAKQVRKILVDSSYTDMEKLIRICDEKNILLEQNNKLLRKISDKENCYVAGIFNKYNCELQVDRPHIVLVNPSNMGNLGTILRTTVGFGIYDVAIVLPAADLYNPKTVRSSMGAMFKLNISHFDTFEEYQKKYQNHQLFTFMLDGENTLSLDNCPRAKLYSLVFGNEATGLAPEFAKVGTSIFIPQSPDVDSLNLTIAVGIGAYVFTTVNRT